MKTVRSLIGPLLLLTLLAGCVTRPRIDWNVRIGHYTYNQAVVELGVPDKYAKLSDSTIVAEWVLYTSSPAYATYGFGGGYWGGPFWGPEFAYGYPVGPYYRRWLRLVFGPDDQLRSWQKFDR
jgi:hypothetical protein